MDPASTYVATLLPDHPPAPPTVQIDRGVPPEIGAIVARLLDEFRHYWPPWLVLVDVFYVDDLAGYLQIVYAREYCRVSLRVGPAFLSLSEPERRWSMLHEVCHPLTEPLHAFCLRLIDTCAESLGPIATSILREDLRRASEIANVQVWDLVGRLDREVREAHR